MEKLTSNNDNNIIKILDDINQIVASLYNIKNDLYNCSVALTDKLDESNESEDRKQSYAIVPRLHALKIDLISLKREYEKHVGEIMKCLDLIKEKKGE